MAKAKREIAVVPPVAQTPAEKVLAALPPPITFPLVEIGEKLVKLVEEADKAVEAATRLEVKDQASYDAATDLASSAGHVLKVLDTQRKNYTRPLDAAKAKLTELFNIPRLRLDAAVEATKRKMGIWYRAESERRRREAEAQAEAQRLEAQRLAEATAAMGDKAGAQQIIEEAKAVVVEAPKVVGTGLYGGGATMQKRAVGEVTHRLAFLRWAVENQRLTVIDAIDFGQLALNKLARELIDIKAAEDAIPGFAFSETETPTIR